MARITVEDCLKHVRNRFELVVVASRRARELALTNTDSLVPWENDKCTVVALREIASGKLNINKYRDVPIEIDKDSIETQEVELQEEK
ncbi:hypothetical protein BH10PSE19_BH10PSE19_17010 [soil metagenome]